MVRSVNSLLMVTCIKWTPHQSRHLELVPVLSLSFKLILSKMDKISACPSGDHLRESWLYMIQESLKLTQCSRQYYYAPSQFALLFCLCCQVSEGLL